MAGFPTRARGLVGDRARPALTIEAAEFRDRPAGYRAPVVAADQGTGGHP